MDLSSFALGLDGAGAVVLVAALGVAGLVAGVLAGLLGIGGGGVLVPVLYEVFSALDVDPSVRMHATLGTTMAIIAPTALKSFAGHRAKGTVDMALWRRVAPMVVAGVVAGILVARVASGDALKWVWILAASLVAIKLAFGKQSWRLGEKLPGAPWPETAFGVIGFVSALMSIGGATFVVPYLTLYGRSILNAVSTAAGVGTLIAVPGAIGYMWAGWGVEHLPATSLGYVCLAAAAIVAPVSVLAAPVGVRLAHGVNRRTLELAFAAFLALVAARFLASVLS